MAAACPVAWWSCCGHLRIYFLLVFARSNGDVLRCLLSYSASFASVTDAGCCPGVQKSRVAIHGLDFFICLLNSVAPEKVKPIQLKETFDGKQKRRGSQGQRCLCI